ncbi:LysE family translocator [Devosia nitrariae]|uniref:Lysine transporter LysE n=1 Tax=Devosia nitrariae TaxID=2071872 RepID=A0ABQ5VZK3_9HYPH|nr:LysE family translocator [Devosia nitrariae]GLQ53218.1 lysine transporter LysE [Devosia nitrariae]
MSTETLTALIAFAFVTSVTPGPNNLMLLASGANFGVRHTLPHMLGVAIGFTVMVLLVGVGLVGLFEAVPMSYLVLKVLSVAYLLYLAWKIATASGLGEKSLAGKPITFLQAAAFQWVNPKAWSMALTAVTVYAGSRSFEAVALVALVFGIINLPSTGAWAVVGGQLKRFLTDPARLRVFNIVMALLLVASLYPVLFSR